MSQGPLISSGWHIQDNTVLSKQETAVLPKELPLNPAIPFLIQESQMDSAFPHKSEEKREHIFIVKSVLLLVIQHELIFLFTEYIFIQTFLKPFLV